MLVVFSPFFVADAKIIFRYNFVAPLMTAVKIYQIRCSSNLSLDKIYSIVVLRMSVFFSLLNVLPCNRVCDKEKFVNSSILQSILFKVLIRRVYLSSLCTGECRRKCEIYSIFKPQLQTGFKKSWKLCLKLCSRK